MVILALLDTKELNKVGNKPVTTRPSMKETGVDQNL